MKSFDYVTLDDVQAVCNLLANTDKSAKVFAGGTDLLVQIKEGKKNPDILIDLKRLWPQPQIKIIDSMLVIPSVTTHKQLTTQIKSYVTNYPALAVLVEASKAIGSPQIRNRGTVGGNLVNASPAGDLAPAFIALNALVEITNGLNVRKIPVEQFFTGPGKTVLQCGEIVSAVLVDLQNINQAASFIKLGTRNALAISIVNIAVSIKVDLATHVFEAVSIGFGSVAPVPAKAVTPEQYLLGKKVSLDVIEEAARLALNDVSPIGDIRATAEYRRAMVPTVVERGLVNCLSSLNIKVM